MRDKEIVGITGMGIWSCIGHDLDTVRESLKEGRCGIGKSEQRQKNGYQSCLMGMVGAPTEEESIRFERMADHYAVPKSVRRSMTEQAKWAAMAVSEAVMQAKLSDVDLFDCALIVSSDSAMSEAVRIANIMHETNDTRALGGYSVFKSLNSNVSMTLAQFFHFSSLSLSVSAACAGGGHAVGLAKTLIENGVVERCIVVGAQENDLSSSWSFDALGIFSQSDDPAKSCRPFDRKHDGLVPSGGAAAVVLERCKSLFHEHSRFCIFAHRPSADAFIPALAVVSGYGFTTSPHFVQPDWESYYHTMTLACNDAMVPFSSIDMIVAHATGTPGGDEAEGMAILAVCNNILHSFGSHYHQIAEKGLPKIVATKCLTGHECWMSGVSQVVYTVLQMMYGFISPIINLEEPIGPVERLNLSCHTMMARTNRALLNSFGFGGTNASLVITNDC